MDSLQHAIAAACARVEALAAERRSLRLEGGSDEQLELNEQRLVRAQRELSRLLIEHHRPRPAAA